MEYTVYKSQKFLNYVVEIRREKRCEQYYMVGLFKMEGSKLKTIKKNYYLDWEIADLRFKKILLSL